MRIRTVDLPTGITMAYAWAGPAGAPVLGLVHGLDSSRHQFVGEIERFRHRYRVLAPSLRGHGETTNAPDPTDDDYTPVVRAAALPQLLIRCAADRGINASLASTLTALDGAHDARVVPLADAGGRAMAPVPVPDTRPHDGPGARTTPPDR